MGTGTSWAWWLFSTVILAIVLNLISSYLKPYIDRQFERFSDSRRVKNAKQKARIEQAAHVLLADPTLSAWHQGKITLQAFVGGTGFILLIGSVVVSLVVVSLDNTTDLPVALILLILNPMVMGTLIFNRAGEQMRLQFQILDRYRELRLASTIPPSKQDEPNEGEV